MKKIILFTIILCFTSLFAGQWHPDEWYFADPVEFKYQKSVYHETVQEVTYHLLDGETPDIAEGKAVRLLVGKTLLDRGVEVSGHTTTYDSESNGVSNSFIEKQIDLIYANKSDKFAYSVIKQNYNDTARTYYLKATCYLNKDQYMVGTWRVEGIRNNTPNGINLHTVNTEAFYPNGECQASEEQHRGTYVFSDEYLSADGSNFPILEKSKDKLVWKVVWAKNGNYKGGYTKATYTRIY